MTLETGLRPWQMRRASPSKVLAALSVALGAFVLLGWGLGLDAPTRVFPGMIAMKPNAALGFVLLGLALWSIGGGGRSARWGVGLSLATTLIGALTLFEYFTGVDLGFDQILHAVPSDQLGTLIPGRMHPTTALDFVLLGVAATLLAADRHHRAAQGLALFAALIAGSTLIGYLFGVRVFVGLAVYHQMALHTTLGMIALAVGLLASRPHRGLMIPIVDDGPAGQMARWLFPVAILTPLVVSGLMILARDARLVDERYGSAVRVTCVIAIFLACVWRGAFTLHRLDRERKRVEAERVDQERRFRFLAEAMPQIVWSSAPDGGLEYLNRRWFDYSGQDPAEPGDWDAIFHPDDLGPCRRLWERSRLSGDRFQGEFRFRRHDGAYRWHLVRSEPMVDEDGRIVRWIGTSTDINDQKRAGEQRYRSLVEATTAIAWNTPASGNFEAEQPRWTAFTGQAFDQLAGWGWLEAIHPEDRDQTARAWATAVEGRSIYQVKHRLRRHDGAYRHMVARAVPLLDDEGEIREWFGVHTDVDDQERANEAMRHAKEAAEASTRAKGEFLANMSHEIRTPMNGVLGMTELALGTDLSPRQREYLGLVKSSADALLTVIDDILDFSKIEAGKLRLEPIPFEPRDLVTDTLRTLSLKAHEKGLELACRIDPEVPQDVVGDPGRLRQVLLNLVGNAIKFTERGEVVVTVEPDPDPEPGDSSSIRFSVSDTGIGIPDEKRKAIFAPFEQADGSTTRKYGGTGLGLTISSRLVELMGGQLSVEANPGGGSVFRFTARLDRDIEGRSSRTSPRPIVLDGLRILIVDDNRTNRMILDEVLTQWGCRPLAAPGAAEALVAMDRAADRGEPFDLVLLDRIMPVTDGCSLARKIRADPRHARAKLMMLTSGGPDDSGLAEEVVIEAWLAKPIRQSDLLGAILDLLGPEGATPRPTEPSKPSAATRPLRVLVAEDHPINQKVATRMLQDQGHSATVAANGRLALEALASGEFDVVLMDVQMPEMDGFEALSEIRRLEQESGSPRMPVIAVTAHAMAGDRERCLDAGFDQYIPKPIQAAGLAEALARVDGPPAVASTPVEQTPAPPEDARPAFDLEQALDGVAGDESFLRELLGLFLVDGPRYLAEAREALERGDASGLRTVGHTSAGSAGYFAAPHVVEAARRLERLGESGQLAEAEAEVLAFGFALDRFRRAVVDSGVMQDAAPAPGP